MPDWLVELGEVVRRADAMYGRIRELEAENSRLRGELERIGVERQRPGRSRPRAARDA